MRENEYIYKILPPSNVRYFVFDEICAHLCIELLHECADGTFVILLPFFSFQLTHKRAKKKSNVKFRKLIFILNEAILINEKAE